MSGDIEQGTCDVCGKKDVQLGRMYFHYDVNCSCCSGDDHFELVRHCKFCTPKPPKKITAYVSPKTDW